MTRTAQNTSNAAEYEGVTARQHATYFFYLGYGKRLPLDWVRQTGGAE